MFRSIVTLLVAVFLCVSFAQGAVIEPSALAKDFQYAEAKLSPDGTKLAVAIRSDGKRRLAVFNVSDFKPVGGANLGERREVGQFYWANNERIVMQIWERVGWKAESENRGELFAIDYDGSNSEIIFGYRASDNRTGTRLKKKESTYSWAHVVSVLPNDDKHILIQSTPMSNDGARMSTVYKLNVYNGRLLNDKVFSPVRYASFISDRDGNVRFASGVDKGDRLKTFSRENDEWVEITNEAGDDFEPLALNYSGDALFYLDREDGDKQGLFTLDLKTGERKTIYVDDNVDISGIAYNSDRSSVYALSLNDGYPSYVMFNDAGEEAKLFKSLLATFQGYNIRITSRSRDRSLWVLYVSNDIDAGSYYLYNRKENQLVQLFANLSHIDINLMAESKPVTFASFDETPIPGYITYPLNMKADEKVPLVTLVHGGPHGPRDYWSFDRDVQMLAAQGYAVLRVNFRGSGGYGNNFMHSGYRQWGGVIQKDIIAGTRWAIEQGNVDASKVCIMGASFGGYSAVMSPILAPDLFKCSVAHVGVYDLEMMYEEGDIPTRLWGEAYLNRAIGTDEQQLRAFSPVNHVDKLRAEVFIAHGEEDRRVPFEHALALRKQLDKHNKPYEWFVKSTESHGFYDEENREEYYENVARFLKKHLQ